MIEDLEHRLDYVVTERKRLSGIEKAKLDSYLVGRGVSSGSGAVLGKETLAREQLDEVIPVLVADVDRARQVGAPEVDLRAALDRAVASVMQVLRDGFIEKPNLAFGGSSYGARPAFLDELEARAQSQVRQYWAGYLTPNAPPGSYSLTLNNSPGTAIQQGGAGNTQTVTNIFNLQAARAAAAALGTALAALPASDAREDAEADLAALQRHLAKPEPPPRLVRELGKALRTGVGKLFGGFASASGEAAAEQLWEALDL